MLPKKYRLPAKEFRYVYSKGLKFRGQHGMLVALTTSSTPKFGFVLNKKIGNAVQRHRMTRLLRVIVIELTKELELDKFKFNFEYIAFEFCDSKDELKTEIMNQFKSAIK